MKPKKDCSKPYKNRKIQPEEFVSVLMANFLTDGKPKSKTRLARDLGISRRNFYDLLILYASELEKVKEHLQRQIYHDLYFMLRKRLRGKWDLSLATFALGMSGNTFPQTGGMNGLGGNGLIQNFYGMELASLEQLMAKHFQEARRKNSSKPGRKA